MTPLFTIFKRDKEEIARVLSIPNDPHKHEWEELIIVTEGIVEHFIDFKKEVLHAPLVSFVTKGKIHRVNILPKNGKCELWGIRFKSEFIPETTFQLYSYFHDHANILIEEGPCFNRLITLCEMMEVEMNAGEPDYSVTRHLLSALFTMIEAERRRFADKEHVNQKSLNNTFKNFLILLEENFRSPEGADFYAQQLHMSSRNLNKICQHILQQTVTEIIETRKLIEAKNLLISTDKSISEIGFELSFNEKAYFTNVFKKKSGQTPTEFRNEMRKLIS